MDKLGMVLDSVARMTNRFEETNEKYKEILVLEKMLAENYIPYMKEPLFGGWHICYPTSGGSMVCSIIEHDGSYGREDDLLEIMGLLTEEEKKLDSVIGYLSAKEVFERIKKHYEIGGQQ